MLDTGFDEYILSCSVFYRACIVLVQKTVKTAAYTSMVRPTVEYASTVWDPVNQKKHQITGSGTETSGTICCVTNMVKTLE
jgi:predicted aspartyl protease